MVKINSSNKKKINKVKLVIVKKKITSSGNLFKLLNKNDKHFQSFGEAYISELNSFSVKAWRYHKKSTQNFFLINGRCKFVYYFNNKFKYIILSSVKKPKLLIVPKKIWYGFQNLTNKKCTILNFIDLRYSENEILRKEKNKLDFKW